MRITFLWGRESIVHRPVYRTLQPRNARSGLISRMLQLDRGGRP